MIIQMNDTPDSMVGFTAYGDVTKDNFDSVVIPAVKKFVQEKGELNYLLVLDTSVANFTLGAWWKDALLGLNNITKWNRAAIVSDSKIINTFTNIFSIVMPGEFKGFTHAEIPWAIDWVAGKSSGKSF